MKSGPSASQSYTSWVVPQMDGGKRATNRTILLTLAFEASSIGSATRNQTPIPTAPPVSGTLVRSHRPILIRSFVTRAANICIAFFFSHTGNGGMTICFHCGVGLKDWRAEDDPWTEHAIWSPFCVYIRYLRGSGFVEEFIIMRDC